MSIVIKLDAPAVRELIKDNSEAHLQLSQAVVQEIVKRMRLPDSFDAKALVEKEFNSIAKEVPIAYVLNGYKPVLSTKAVELIRDQVKSVYQSTVRAQVIEEIAKMVEEEKQRTMVNMDVNIRNRFAAIEPELDRLARQLLSDRLNDVLKATSCTILKQ